ncbi:hypothetical protein ABZ776_15620 [Streptomyces sp. NPDC007076]|uniref:hypothetical protein n=1 Tax=unclassified Streptomyces TaxID=2593676 RepID=UPI002E77BB64|nr:hypothetical protein [Streptomyces sp. JV190]MEE1845001.1 hypothetical protein [Streptomyces sp. JV190]
MTVVPHDQSRGLNRRQLLITGLAASALLATSALPSPDSSRRRGRRSGRTPATGRPM